MNAGSDDIELPLYELYKTVKELDEKTGHAGIDLKSYLTLLETMQRGYMLVSKEGLSLLCEKLWIKPYHRNSDILNSEILKALVAGALGESLQSEKLPDINPDSQATSKKPDRKKRKSANDKVVPKQEAPPPPSDYEKEISKQQGSLSISIKAVDVNTDELKNVSLEEPKPGFLDKSFLVKGVYLPVSLRRIEQSIRLYRQKIKGIGKWEIDWPRTVQEISKTRHFTGFVMQESDLFSTHFTVLVDDSASMAAFSSYSDNIASLISKSSLTQNDIYDYDDIYYFSNWPDDHLYNDRTQATSVPLNKFLYKLKRSILIISDAGAARGSVNKERIKATLRFLRKIRKYQIAWLNPMPRIRWKNTSAEMIAQFVDMFDIGEGETDELANIVRLFKSKIQTS